MQTFCWLLEIKTQTNKQINTQTTQILKYKQREVKRQNLKNLSHVSNMVGSTSNCIQSFRDLSLRSFGTSFFAVQQRGLNSLNSD